MKEVYAVFLADTQGNFNWVYTKPKAFYEDRKEAEAVMQELIKTEQVPESKIKIKELWK